jgi:D-galactarolactone isomerase
MSQDLSPPRLKAPAGTIDTHIHIYDRKYPLAPTATFTPPDASVADYLKVCERLGIARTVVIQPTGYGTDNRCTLEAMQTLGRDRARGIAVVDISVTDAELDRMTKAGIRGIRFFMLKGGALSWDVVDDIAARVTSFGWHINLQLDGRTFPDFEERVKRFPGTLVVDHVGKFLEPVGVDHPGMKVILRLLDNGRTYLKLAAPYETSKKGPPNYDDVGAMAKTFVKAAPDRMMWASNWPQPNPPGGIKPDNAVMLDMLLDWVPDEATRRKVLVDNPARVYGF